MKRLFRCPSGSWPVAGGYGTAEEDKESKSAVGLGRLPTRVVGWIRVKVAVDMRCRGMLLRGKLSLSRKNMCRRARMSVVQLQLPRETWLVERRVDASRRATVCNKNNPSEYVQRYVWW